MSGEYQNQLHVHMHIIPSSEKSMGDGQRPRTEEGPERDISEIEMLAIELSNCFWNRSLLKYVNSCILARKMS